MKKRLLVTGASGFLGQQICHFPQKDWDIVGTFFMNPENIPNSFEKMKINFGDFFQISERPKKARDLSKTLSEIKPDAILHLAANANITVCEQHSEVTNAINAKVPIGMAEYANTHQIPFLFVSTEQVFDGLSEVYFENSPANPQTEYGKQKLRAEQEILNNEIYASACICRISVLFGKAKNTRNFMIEWLKKWKKGEEVTVFYDEIRTFLSGNAAAAGLFFLLNNNQKGLFHLAGIEAISRLEFAEKLAKVFKIQNPKINSLSQKDLNLSSYRPPILNLKCPKIENLGFQLKGVEEELQKISEKN